MSDTCGVCGADDCESAHAAPVAQLVCRTPDCDRQNRVTQIHADTVLPVTCGGCGAVLHCVHAWEPVQRREGTLGAPVDVKGRRCPACGTEDVKRTPGTPVNLTDLPVSVLEQLGA